MISADHLFNALYDPTRRAVLARLRYGPQSVSEIARGLPVTRPAVSQHLKILKDAGLVSDRNKGTRRFYSIDPEGLAALRAWTDQFWEAALDASAAEAERSFRSLI
jgi:DNA-binding transcriptional ArsR family regulator